MAESLVGKIVSNAGKQWNRNTVADGTWLNTNTIQKFNENDKTLAEAIESVSAAMEHFTPEITPSAWPCAANSTIQTIEQNADGSLNVTYQSIESSTTSDDSLWSLYQHEAYDSVLAAYTEPEEDINHISGELSESLTIPAGIYDVKVEVLYEPTQNTINNKLDIAISKSTSIDDALYQTFILFDDSLIKDTTSNPQKIDVQSQWITGIIKLTESTTLKFLIKGESAQGRYKLNNIYINSIIGVKGDKGDPGSPGAPGADGVSPTVAITPITNGQHIVITDKQGDHSFDLTNGESGEDGKTPLLQIDSTNAHWQYRYSTSEQWADIPNTPAASGTKGDDGISPKVRINDTTNYWEISEDGGTTWDPTNVSATGAPGRNGTDGISPTVSTSAIPGGNRVTFTYNDGTETPATEYIDVMSGVSGAPGHTPVISMTATDISRESQGQTQNGTEVKFTIDGTDTTYSAWNGLNGSGSMSQVYTAGYIEGTGVDQQDAVQLTQEAVDAIEAVSGKVNKPDTSLIDKYLVLRTDINGAVSGWCDYNDKIYSKTESDGRYVQKSGDTMTGQLVVNTTTNHPFIGISQRGDSDDFAVFGATRKKSNNNNFGTTWLGVGSEGQGVLKNIPNTSTSASTEPESNGAYTQITFSQNNAVPSIDINAKLNETDHNYKSVVVPQQSYNNMSAFDATNGPNYMLRKLSDGSFDIGACVINVTSIPQTTEANTYYFVYDV